MQVFDLSDLVQPNRFIINSAVVGIIIWSVKCWISNTKSPTKDKKISVPLDRNTFVESWYYFLQCKIWAEKSRFSMLFVKILRDRHWFHRIWLLLMDVRDIWHVDFMACLISQSYDLLLSMSIIRLGPGLPITSPILIEVTGNLEERLFTQDLYLYLILRLTAHTHNYKFE